MTYPTLTDIEPVVDKLRNLEQYLPGNHRLIYTFGKLFADKLGEFDGPMTPEDFEIVAMDTMDPLVKRQSDVFLQIAESAKIVAKLTDIAKVTCPEEFAQGLEALARSESEE